MLLSPGRPRDRDLEERFWELWLSGLGVPSIEAGLGIRPGRSRHWVREAGGVAPRPAAEPSGRYLSADERELIGLRKAAGVSNADIARELGRHPSTIGREIRRNSDPPVTKDMVKREYRPHRAHRRAWQRGRRPKPAKLRADVNPALHGYVQGKLERRWSPEQIAKQLLLEFPERPEMRVSHETIYQSLYVQSRGALRRDLTKALRTGRALRRPKRRSDERRSRIPDMVMISERPAEVADRAVPGHWEGDLIVGADSGSAIGTLVERSTRFVMLLHLPERHGAAEVEQAMISTIETLPEQLRRSVTWDQGSEMTNHAKISVATGLEIYFCDPHSPWQRGSNENTNGLLRQYFPKGTDLSEHSAEHLRFVAEELNDRPRKTLGWKSPRQALTELLVATTD